MGSFSERIKRCAHMKADGQRCKAPAMRNSDLCFFHEPGKAQERAAARKAGGIRRAGHAVVLSADTPDIELTSPAQVAGLLAETINQVRRGELDCKIAYVIGHLSELQMKACCLAKQQAALQIQMSSDDEVE
jgi:hypothetical protein